jgi:hypothetical protein
VSKIDPSKLSIRLEEVLTGNGFIDGWLYHVIDKRLSQVCESPIEAMLGAALLFMDKFESIPGYPLILERQECVPHWGPEERLLIPQFKFQSYRIDWVYRDGANLTFIECDGHDFHERTKQQASRDKKRDREIQAAGYPLLRFTGSEIWEDPFHCASQIAEFVGDRNIPPELRDPARV